MSDVITVKEGFAGRLRLNRPKALNSLNRQMVRDMARALIEWRDDPDVRIILIDHPAQPDGDGKMSRGFCAGGDVVDIANSVEGADAAARAFFFDEYRLNHLEYTYAKPGVAFMDGITMGGGVGIACPCRYRVATERTILAMPETTIGIFPDVGGGRYLSRLRGRLAQFLALTGARLDGAECLKLRLATHYIPSDRLEIAKERIMAQPFRVQAILDVAGVGGLGGQYPGRISGGQQQRVALARALVSDSSVVLFDEPLSNVDTQVRARLRFELRKLQQEIGFSALYVTHDQSEALELGHQVAVLDSGRVADVGAPQRVYAAPANEYVANFVGVANLFPLTITSHQEGSLRADSELGPLQIDIDAGSSWKTGDAAIAVVRPEDVSIRRLEPQLPVNGFQGRIEALLFGGAHTELVVSSKESLIRVWSTAAAVSGLREKDEVMVCFDRRRIHLIRQTASAMAEQCA